MGGVRVIGIHNISNEPRPKIRFAAPPIKRVLKMRVPLLVSQKIDEELHLTEEHVSCYKCDDIELTKIKGLWG